MDFRSSFLGNAIREYRLNKGLSQEVVSGQASVPRSHLSDIELGKVNPKVDTLWAICDALDVSASEILSAAEKAMYEYRGDK